MKIFIFPAILLAVVVLLIPVQTAFAEGYNLKIQLPTEQGPVTTITGPADYIRNFYNFGLLAVGLLAMLMIVIGAIQYSTSGGDTSKISDAKDRIYKAILGIALLLGAYILLRTINPELVLLKNPALTTIHVQALLDRVNQLEQEKLAILPELSTNHQNFEATKQNANR